LAADVLIVSLGSTAGLRAADEELAAGLRRAGAGVVVAAAQPAAAVRTFMLTDLVWARSARRAAEAAIAEHSPRATVYSTTTAALLWPRGGAIRFDAPAAANRPGRHGLWQRPLERRRVGSAPLLLPSSEGALEELPSALRGAARARALVVPVPVEPSGPPAPVRDIAALTYGANPTKKGLDRVLAAWRALRPRRPPQEELVIAGVGSAELERAGLLRSGEPGVRPTGLLDPHEYRALLRRARVFVCAPRREDYGLVQLEALADGCRLVTTAAPGPYVALPIARRLDPRLVGEDLAAGLAAALDTPRPDYAERALAELAPFSRAAVDRLLADQLLARLFA
jgi:glycosyltransferase involved in cell wall biosynthesis